VASFEPTGSYELLTSISIRLVEALSASGDDWTFLDFFFSDTIGLSNTTTVYTCFSKYLHLLHMTIIRSNQRNDGQKDKCGVPSLSPGGAHRGRVYVCAFIGVSVCTCM
jgi:hypothetical protein